MPRHFTYAAQIRLWRARKGPTAKDLWSEGQRRRMAWRGRFSLKFEGGIGYKIEWFESIPVAAGDK